MCLLPVVVVVDEVEKPFPMPPHHIWSITRMPVGVIVMGSVSVEFAIVGSVLIILVAEGGVAVGMPLEDHPLMLQTYFVHTVPTLLTARYHSRLFPAALPESNIKMAS